jgi:hypothetical protein
MRFSARAACVVNCFTYHNILLFGRPGQLCLHCWSYSQISPSDAVESFLNLEALQRICLWRLNKRPRKAGLRRGIQAGRNIESRHF